MSEYVFIGHRYTKGFIDDFRRTIKLAFEPYSEKLKIKYADSYAGGEHILLKIVCPLIDEALLCVFDISEESKPNVFIEVGYALGKGKFFVLTSKKHAPSPFGDYHPPTNLGGFRVIIYDSYEELLFELLEHLPDIIARAEQPVLAETAATVALHNLQIYLDEFITIRKMELHRAALKGSLLQIAFDNFSSDAKDYSSDKLFKLTNDAICKNREMCRGLQTMLVGDLCEFFEEHYNTEDRLRPFLEKEIEPVLKSERSQKDKFEELKMLIETEEESVFSQFYQIIADKVRSLKK